MRLSGGQSLADGSTAATPLFSSLREENANESPHSGQSQQIRTFYQLVKGVGFVVYRELIYLSVLTVQTKNRRRTFSVLRPHLYLLGKTNDAVRFLEANVQVEPQTVGIGQLTVAGKFCASLGLGPVFAGFQQLFGNARVAVVR